MINKSLVVIVIIFVLTGYARAGNDFFGTIDPKDRPSIINYGWAELQHGALLGLSIGSIRVYEGRDKLNSEGKRKRITNGALYGVIGGTALGLGIGFYDFHNDQTGFGAFLIRDMWLGGALGLAVGTAVGGISYSNTNNSRHIWQSMAWGYIGGSIAGLGFGMIEGPKLAYAPYEKNTRVGFAMLPDSKGMPSIGISLNHRF
ncbi:MAG: hypothetical protein PHX78_03150 [bacterium]|nr:hypothetical protein [bacterium]